MRKVVIGTPAHDGRVDVWYAHSLVESIRLCAPLGIDLRPIFLSYDALVQNARNDLVRIALRSECTDLIFIDADQEWKPEWIPRLLGYPVDCVGAAVRKKTDAEEKYNVRIGGGIRSLEVNPQTGLWTSDDMALGCGLLRMSRTALQALWDASEKYVVYPSKEESAWVFDIRPVNGVLVGEDTAACMKLRAAGIATWVDPRMTAGHVGVKKYSGDFHGYIKRLMEAENRAA